MADLNTAELDGAHIRSQILGQASMMPFLTPRRLIMSATFSPLDRRMAASKGPRALPTPRLAILEGLNNPRM